MAATSPDGETYALTTTLDRDDRGLPILAPVNLMGVLYTSGEFIAEGDAVYYGSVVASGNVTQISPLADKIDQGHRNKVIGSGDHTVGHHVQP